MVKFIPTIATLLTTLLAFTGAQTTSSSTVLVLARDQTSSTSATSGLRGYGIPYELVLVPQSGAELPTLNSSATEGNYGGILVLSELAYSYSDAWRSALTSEQWNALYQYQTQFGARMVRLDVYPGEPFGATTAIAGAGCCDTGVEQLVSISDASAFPTAGIKTGAGMSTSGLWHYPATITNETVAEEIAQFGPGGSFSNPTTAAVINTFGSRQQMVWFTSWATDWSPTSSFLQHAYINWMTRGLFVGRRRIYLSTQVDDVHLPTDLYLPADTTFRVRPGDLDAHVSWTQAINGRMPAGSSYFVELAHNGNGDIEAATSRSGSDVCQPDEPIYTDDQADTPLEFQKPLGTGINLWPSTPESYAWSLTCAKLDDLANWFTDSGNRDAFAHVSHTFTHMALNNATFEDTDREMFFNIAWMEQLGIAGSSRYSPNGLVPPAITGLHNGDAIRAFMENGITSVVGDNTRPPLRNQEDDFWPLISTTSANGYDGLIIVPRWATTIYYNCDLPQCTTQEWIDTSAGAGDFNDLLDNARRVNIQHLLALHQDPFMFHQANMRQTDVPSITVGSQTGKLSLLQAWVETIVQELTRLTDWPIVSLKHDDIATQFVNRMTVDKCQPTMSYVYSSSGTAITGVTVSAADMNCAAPVPVTFPGSATTGSSGATREQLGNDPLTIWVTLSGSPVTLTLDEAIQLQ